jgi:hypothetical protein
VIPNNMPSSNFVKRSLEGIQGIALYIRILNFLKILHFFPCATEQTKHGDIENKSDNVPMLHPEG